VRRPVALHKQPHFLPIAGSFIETARNADPVLRLPLQNDVMKGRSGVP